MSQLCLYVKFSAFYFIDKVHSFVMFFIWSEQCTQTDLIISAWFFSRNVHSRALLVFRKLTQFLQAKNSQRKENNVIFQKEDSY